MEMLKCIITCIPLETHEIKGMNHLMITRNKHQMDMIDLEDESKDTKIQIP
jgi:chemotaxis receptor (MCP) glutamine deamidase CheD